VGEDALWIVAREARVHRSGCRRIYHGDDGDVGFRQCRLDDSDDSHGFMAEYKTVLSFGVTKLPVVRSARTLALFITHQQAKTAEMARSFRGRSHPISGHSYPGRLINFRRVSLAQRIGPSFPCITVATPEIVRRGAISSHPCSRTGDKAVMARISLP
jgi:hypothetical protein